MLIQATKTATAFGCDATMPSPSLAGPAASGWSCSASGAIDVVDFTGVINSPVAAEHSLQFSPDPVIPDTDANNDVDTNWCRTFAADSKGATGDGCDEYRINEVLWRPADMPAPRTARRSSRWPATSPRCPARGCSAAGSCAA